MNETITIFVLLPPSLVPWLDATEFCTLTCCRRIDLGSDRLSDKVCLPSGNSNTVGVWNRFARITVVVMDTTSDITVSCIMSESAKKQPQNNHKKQTSKKTKNSSHKWLLQYNLCLESHCLDHRCSQDTTSDITVSFIMRKSATTTTAKLTNQITTTKQTNKQTKTHTRKITAVQSVSGITLLESPL